MNAALKENLAEVSDKLPVELLAEVIDFAEFLREKERRKQAETKQKKKARVRYVSRSGLDQRRL